MALGVAHLQSYSKKMTGYLDNFVKNDYSILKLV